MSRSSTARWRDFVALREGDRRELVDGHLQASQTTKWQAFAVAALTANLRTWSRGQPFKVLGSGYRVRVSDTRGAVPDVQLLSDEVFDSAGANGLEAGHPELVIEVISPTSRTHDGLRKLDWYAKIGVPEYWLVDPEARTLVVHRLQQRVYAIVQHAQADEVFRSKTFKGLKVPLAELWSVLPKR